MSSPSSIVRVVQLMYKKQLISDGTTTYSYMDVDTDEFEDWGPYLTSIQIHTSTENRTANHKWVVALYWSADGRQWAGPVALHTEATTASDVIQTAYTTNTQLGLHLRLAIGVANTSGSAIERAVASAWAVFTFKS